MSVYLLTITRSHLGRGISGNPRRRSMALAFRESGEKTWAGAVVLPKDVWIHGPHPGPGMKTRPGESSMTESIHVIHHAGCTDGFGAAWAAWLELGDQAGYHPASYGDQPPRMKPGSRVYILDFSYPRETMLELVRKHQVTLLDHHETAQEDIGDLPGCHFDTGHSGAVLAWNHFHGGLPIPQILHYVEDRDLWKWELKHSREISAVIASHKFSFETWTRISGIQQDDLSRPAINMIAMAPEGAGILRAEGRNVERITAGVVIREIAGANVPVVNTPVLASEACERLLEMYPEAPFAAAYHDLDGSRKWSLRSRTSGSFDVSKVAQMLGGGGHPHAAGFTETL